MRLLSSGRESICMLTCFSSRTWGMRQKSPTQASASENWVFFSQSVGKVCQSLKELSMTCWQLKIGASLSSKWPNMSFSWGTILQRRIRIKSRKGNTLKEMKHLEFIRSLHSFSFRQFRARYSWSILITRNWVTKYRKSTKIYLHQDKPSCLISRVLHL